MHGLNYNMTNAKSYRKNVNNQLTYFLKTHFYYPKKTFENCKQFQKIIPQKN